MAKALAIGTVLFLAVLVARAPAGLITHVLPDNAPLKLAELRGTLWHGNATLGHADGRLGRLDWRLQPAALLGIRLGYDLSLTGPAMDLGGTLRTGLDSAVATISGEVQAAPINDWLRIYNMRLSGHFTAEAIEVTIDARKLVASEGRLRWTGGPVTYVLSGKVFNTTLPPLFADLGPGPEAIAYAEGEPTPLLVAALKPDGFATVGVTKRLTEILGNPWPGGDPGYKVVLEVEEQVF
jgi:hypothetical protein